MKYRPILLAAAASVFLAVSVLTGGCGKQETPPPAPLYGVADLETLVKAHPRYSEYYKLETEYERLTDQYKEGQHQLIQISSRQNTSEVNELVAKSMDEEYQTKMKAKEDELNAALQNQYDQIAAKHRSGGSAPPPQPVLISNDDNTRIANLQMKISVLNVTGDDRKKTEEELKEILNRKSSSVVHSNGGDGFTQEEQDQLLSSRKKSEQELSEYAASLSEELLLEKSGRMDAAMKAAENNDGFPSPEIWNSDWQKKLDAKQKEMAAVKEAIMADIREKAAVVGKEKNLEMIFTSYRVNLNAVDVTGDIVNEMIDSK